MWPTATFTAIAALCVCGGPGWLWGSIGGAVLPQAAPKPVVRIVDGAVREAAVLHMVKPTYPPEAVKRRIQGIVNLSVLIGKNGHVKKIRVESGHRILVDATEAAVRQWMYKPTLFQGKPVEAETGVTVVFELRHRTRTKSSSRERDH
jgi:TonB family protein